MGVIFCQLAADFVGFSRCPSAFLNGEDLDVCQPLLLASCAPGFDGQFG